MRVVGLQRAHADARRRVFDDERQRAPTAPWSGARRSTTISTSGLSQPSIRTVPTVTSIDSGLPARQGESSAALAVGDIHRRGEREAAAAGRSTRAHYTFAHACSRCIGCSVLGAAACSCCAAVRRASARRHRCCPRRRSRSPADTSCSAPRSSATIAPRRSGLLQLHQLRIQRAAQPPRSACRRRFAPTITCRCSARCGSIQGRVLEAYGLFVRVRPWPARRFDIQAGRVPPTFGAMIAHRVRQQQHPDRPAARLSVPDVDPARCAAGERRRPAAHARPRLAVEISRRQHAPTARGCRSSTPAAGTPACRCTASTGMVEWTGAVTAGSLSDPRFRDNNSGRQLPGRVGGAAGGRDGVRRVGGARRVARRNARGRRRRRRRRSIAAGRVRRRRRVFGRAVPRARRGDPVVVDAAGSSAPLQLDEPLVADLDRCSRAATRSRPGSTSRRAAIGSTSARCAASAARPSGRRRPGASRPASAIRSRATSSSRARGSATAATAAACAATRCSRHRCCIGSEGALRADRRPARWCAAVHGVRRVALRRAERAAGGIRGRLDIRKLAKPVERRPDVAAPGAAGPRDAARPAPRRRVSRNRAARRLRRARARPRGHGSAQRALRAARARRDGRHGRRLSRTAT